MALSLLLTHPTSHPEERRRKGAAATQPPSSWNGLSCGIPAVWLVGYLHLFLFWVGVGDSASLFLLSIRLNPALWSVPQLFLVGNSRDLNLPCLDQRVCLFAWLIARLSPWSAAASPAPSSAWPRRRTRRRSSTRPRWERGPKMGKPLAQRSTLLGLEMPHLFFFNVYQI